MLRSDATWIAAMENYPVQDIGPSRFFRGLYLVKTTRGDIRGEVSHGGGGMSPYEGKVCLIDVVSFVKNFASFLFLFVHLHLYFILDAKGRQCVYLYTGMNI